MKRSSSAGFVPVAIILNVVLAVLLLSVSGFAIWAFMQYQDYKNNVDPKLSAAAEQAKATQQKQDNAAFLEQEKQPTRTLVGPEELGAVTLDYPKTWSVYIGNNGTGSTYEAYLYPGAVPPLNSNTAYALRVSVVSMSYDSVMAVLANGIKTGDLKTSPVTAASTDGVRFDGKLSQTTQGTMVVFKVRDKTLKVYTETTAFQGDFDKIVLPSLKFNK
jgi:hypothetical protein